MISSALVRKIGVLVISVVLAGLVWLWIADNSFGTSIKLLPGESSVVRLGKKVYAVNCASCHGDKLQGQINWQQRNANGNLPAPPHNETGHTWHHNDKLLFDLTKKGLKVIAGADYKTNMPTYEDILSDQEIIAVLSFIKSTWPEEIRTRHDAMNKAMADSEK
ncbi:MAG: cytochrome c [Alphaproteobacteria bacterium]|jgi:S-disulfanyl-L-cysteine oxidoreductase SoxD|nr:cytochrome c [Alphaproteobacteria bacterium]MBT4020172.1 cytochrome c [Alphaproteobacteria bacterium]MBT4964641.1 cytochrome c [Alphaproteobacteria bacterium]MBT5159280.1 cytochrome c [Alphaproteobacteria bacterium]MBT5918497.1 cytochrome c [Alphaproteobacteria bacterium]